MYICFFYKPRRIACKSSNLIIINKKSEQPIGIAGFDDIQFNHRRADLFIGLPNRSNNLANYATEAVLLMYEHAFNKVGLNKLAATVYGHNEYAQKAFLSLGFHQECYLKEHLANPDGSGFIDTYGNGILLRDFRSNQRLAKISKRLLGRDITQPNTD